MELIDISFVLILSILSICNIICLFIIVKIFTKSPVPKAKEYYLESLSLQEMEQYISTIFISYIKLSIEKDVNLDNTTGDQIGLIYTSAYTMTIEHFSEYLDFFKENFSEKYIENLLSGLFLSLRRSGDIKKMINKNNV